MEVSHAGHAAYPATLDEQGDRRAQQAIYTHGHAEPVLRSHRWRTAANSAAHLLPHLRSGQRLLDVGCGPATLTVDLGERVAPGRAVGLEWRTWAEHEDGWFSLLHGEVLARG